jgi:hypothetical protein
MERGGVAAIDRSGRGMSRDMDHPFVSSGSGVGMMEMGL